MWVISSLKIIDHTDKLFGIDNAPPVQAKFLSQDINSHNDIILQDSLLSSKD